MEMKKWRHEFVAAATRWQSVIFCEAPAGWIAASSRNIESTRAVGQEEQAADLSNSASKKFAAEADA